VISAEIGRTRLPRGHGRKHHEYVLPVTGERGLWQAVLGRAIKDCFPISRTRPTIKNKDGAMRWLFSPLYEEDRNMVCDMAGIDFDSWSDELRSVIDYLDGKNHCDLLKDRMFAKKEVAHYITKMFARHGR